MAGKQAQGTTISRETTLGSGTYVVLGNVKGFDGPGTQASEIDTTDLSATAKTSVPGLVDYGELSMDVNFDPDNASHQQAQNDMEAATVTNWRVTFPSGVRYTWNAFVKSCPLNGQVDALLGAKVALKLTGPRVVS